MSEIREIRLNTAFYQMIGRYPDFSDENDIITANSVAYIMYCCNMPSLNIDDGGYYVDSSNVMNYNVTESLQNRVNYLRNPFLNHERQKLVAIAKAINNNLSKFVTKEMLVEAIANTLYAMKDDKEFNEAKVRNTLNVKMPKYKAIYSDAINAIKEIKASKNDANVYGKSY